MECLITEINRYKTQWALLNIYCPPPQNKKYFYEELGKPMDYLSDTHENFIVVDFNNEEHEPDAKNFMDAYGLKSMVQTATCFKSDTNPRTIDLILTNKSKCFVNTFTLRGISTESKYSVHIS